MNYTEFKTAIQDYCQNTETSFVTHNDEFLKHTERKIYRRVNLKVLRKNSSGTVTLGTEYLTTPTDFLAPYSLAVVTASRHGYLLFKDVNFIREAYPNPATTGTPKYYAVFDDDALLLGPTPDANSAVQLHYFHFPETIVTATNTWLGDNGEECLLAGCMVEALGYLKAEQDTLAYWKSQYEECISRLKEDHESKSQTDEYAYGALRIPPS